MPSPLFRPNGAVLEPLARLPQRVTIDRIQRFRVSAEPHSEFCHCADKIAEIGNEIRCLVLQLGIDGPPEEFAALSTVLRQVTRMDDAGWENREDATTKDTKSTKGSEQEAPHPVFVLFVSFVVSEPPDWFGVRVKRGRIRLSWAINSELQH